MRILIIITLFLISLIPFFKVSINGGYSFFGNSVLKEMDNQPGVWGYTTKRVNIWVYLDAKHNGKLLN